MAFYLAGGKPGPVAKAGTAARGRDLDPREVPWHHQPPAQTAPPTGRLRAHPASGAGHAVRDRACGHTRRHDRGGNRRLGLALLVIATAQLMVV